MDSERCPLCVESSFMDYKRNQIEEYKLIIDLLSVLEILAEYMKRVWYSYVNRTR